MLVKAGDFWALFQVNWKYQGHFTASQFLWYFFPWIFVFHFGSEANGVSATTFGLYLIEIETEN